MRLLPKTYTFLSLRTFFGVLFSRPITDEELAHDRQTAKLYERGILTLKEAGYRTRNAK